MIDKLAQLKTMSHVVADTGDIEAMKLYKPIDATTNPSLLLKAAAMPQYAQLIGDSREHAERLGGSEQEMRDNCCDRLAVLVGREILTIIPGRVSTEVDARLSFDTEAMIDRAKNLIDQYTSMDIDKSRVLIKLASTWEGISAARILERENINCNLTLLFSFEQALACADAGVFLVSPFVGRILDWWKKETGHDFDADSDPGVKSVQRIFNYYKSHRYETVVMGASFRNTGEIEALAGCDRLTISPALLEALSQDNDKLAQVLFKDKPQSSADVRVNGEAGFRWALNEDAMATEKLAEGIRLFTADTQKLEVQLIA